MRKIIFSIFLFAFANTITYAQAPGIKWQKCVGGSAEDDHGLSLKLITKEGHYIVAGSTISIDGDINSNHGQSDVFIGEMDTLGNWIWKKTYGGSFNEAARSIISDNDTGYVLLAETASNDGDVHGNHDSLYHTSYDVWIVRLDKVGNITWQKCYGGTKTEHGARMIKTTDGGFAIIGTTFSVDGDITSRVSNSNYNNDIWVLKLDQNGNKQWDKCYGSSDWDYGDDIKETYDGTFYILGNVAGNDYNGVGNHGSTDAWFAKIENTGNLIWSKNIGGSNYDFFQSFIPVEGTNFLLVGFSRSNDGDVSGTHGGDGDAWVVKLDSSGNILWQKCMGGTGQGNWVEVFKDAIIDENGNYMICGVTPSNDGDVSFNHGESDAWFVNMSRNGNLLWEKTFGGKDQDAAFAIENLSNKELLLYGQTKSNDQDVSGNHGDYDIWIVKLGMVNTIAGYAYYDLNSNTVKDSNEILFSLGKVLVKNNTDSILGITSNGNFRIDVDTGSFISSFVPVNNYYNPLPTAHISTFSNYNLTDTVYFAMQPINGKRDLDISMFPFLSSRPGFETRYLIQYQNIGTDTVANGTIQLIKDSKLTFGSSSRNYSSINGNIIKWNYSDLKPSDTASIIVYLSLPQSVNLGDTLHSIATIDPVAGDLATENDTALVSQIVVSSNDPNDKSENHAGTISKSSVAKGEWLTYTVRFQNTGTDTAFNIIVRDTLDSKLDWNSLEMVDASNNYQLNITGGNKCAWYFNSVLLPDSNVNEAASHGYLVYRIKPKTTLVAEDVINNSASIYFDYNLPVQTNTETTTVANDFVLPLHLLSFTAQHNGNLNLLRWSTAEELNTDRFEIQRSNNSGDFTNIGTVRSLNNGKSKNDYVFTDAHPFKAVNYYRLKMVDKDSKFTYSAIKHLNNTASFNVTLYPNPVQQNLTLSFNTEKAMDAQIEIVNARGKKVYSSKMQLAYGSSIQHINIASFAAGNYFVKCITADGQIGLKFVKQ